ncbi:restriction endonuclease subunit S [Microcoleus sp. herbarium19]|uniref:restriction endonuclease subunit S n=1 Tax=unclassified Microcoleus TaxID=2642155 RepID=UPI002FD31D78
MEKDKLSELPKGWLWTNVGEISVRIHYGYTASATDIPTGTKLLRITDIQNNSVKWDSVPYCNIDDSEEQKYLLSDGDLVFARTGATVGKSFLIEGCIPKAVFASYLIRIFLAEEIGRKFVYYFFQSHFYWIQINTGQVGIGQPHVNAQILSQVCIPLAPLNEQRRIVAKLEKLLAKVDTCKERLDKIPGILKRFRQSVLSAACSGRLTADWRENNPDVESAEELLKRIQEERKKRYEEMYEKARQEGKRKPVKPKNLTSLPLELEGLDKLQINWKWTTFNEVCDDITVGYVGSMAQEYVESGVPFLRSLNVKEFRFEPKNLKYISNEFHAKLKKSALSPGDLVVVRSGNAGISCVIPETLKESNCSDLVIARPSKGLNPFYACIFINSSTTRVHIENTKVGIAQGHFNIESMRDTKLPLPPITEQQEIVRRVETLFKTADQIEQRYQKARTYIDQLTQSILAKAFRGELVPQDPNDEPASVLLERIRAERENRENVAKTAKKPAANKKQRSKKAQPQLEPKPPLEPIQLELPLFD